jgi:hypothetical protein
VLFRGTLCEPPFSIEVEQEPGLLRAFTEIASDGQRVVAVVCELADIGKAYAEFSYSIAVVSLDDSHEPFQTQDRTIAAGYIPADVRPNVIPLVADCLLALVEAGKPQGVYRVSKDSHERAMARHHLLTEVLESAGFLVEKQGTDAHGRRFCTMRRNLD